MPEIVMAIAAGTKVVSTAMQINEMKDARKKLFVHNKLNVKSNENRIVKLL